MKKFVLSVFPLFYFLCALFSPFLSIQRFRVHAETTAQYACILNENTYFYSTKDETRGLFLLPQTYYVKVLSKDVDFCYVEYLADSPKSKRLCGYAKTSELTFVDFLPQTPYLYHTFEVSYYINDGLVGDSSFLNALTVECLYYGDYVVGTKTYCYVLRDESFGYVPKPNGFSYPKNSEYADYLSTQIPVTPDGSDETQTPNESMPPAQIAILVVLCLLVPTLATLILKPPRRPPYEQEDF